MTRLAALLSASIRQALPVRRTIVFAVLQIAPTVIYLIATSNRTAEAALRGVVEIGVGTHFALVLPVVSMVIAAGALGNERRDMTMSFITLRPIPRRSIAATKLLAAFMAAGVLNLIGASILGITHAIRYGGGGIIVGLALGALVATAAYVSLFVPIGFLTDRAVVAGMAYLLVFENGVAFAVSGLAFLSPWRLGAATLGAVAEETWIYLDSTAASLTMGRTVTALVVYVVISVAFTSMLLNSRDLA